MKLGQAKWDRGVGKSICRGVLIFIQVKEEGSDPKLATRIAPTSEQGWATTTTPAPDPEWHYDHYQTAHNPAIALQHPTPKGGGNNYPLERGWLATPPVRSTRPSHTKPQPSKREGLSILWPNHVWHTYNGSLLIPRNQEEEYWLIRVTVERLKREVGGLWRHYISGEEQLGVVRSLNDETERVMVERFGV